MFTLVSKSRLMRHWTDILSKLWSHLRMRSPDTIPGWYLQSILNFRNQRERPLHKWFRANDCWRSWFLWEKRENGRVMCWPLVFPDFHFRNTESHLSMESSYRTLYVVTTWLDSDRQRMPSMYVEMSEILEKKIMTEKMDLVIHLCWLQVFPYFHTRDTQRIICPVTRQNLTS